LSTQDTFLNNYSNSYKMGNHVDTCVVSVWFVSDS